MSQHKCVPFEKLHFAMQCLISVHPANLLRKAVWLSLMAEDVYCA